MDCSVFLDKEKLPTPNDLQKALEKTCDLWQELRLYVTAKYPSAKEEWNYPGPKYGWSFRIKDKKRVLVYLLPRKAFFKAAFVFGSKAFDEIMDSTVSEYIKDELQAAKVYAEGRGIRIEVKDKSVMKDLKMLVDFKLKH